MQERYQLLIVLVSLAVAVHIGQSVPYWSVNYCPPEGCLHRCSHIKQTDMEGWCRMGRVQRALGGDVDNDGMCDAICVKSVGLFYINYRNLNGSSFRSPSGNTEKSTTFCQPSTGFHTYVRDINMDGYDDIICVTDDVPNDDQVRVSYIAGRRNDFLTGTRETVTNAMISTALFISSTNSTFSDANRLKRSAICTKYQSQCSHVHQDSIAPVGQWYPWCVPGTGSFFSGDLNGDGYCDVICHSHASNHIQVMFYVADSRTFVAPYETKQADGELGLGPWCDSTNSIVKVIDVNFDGHADIVCALSGLDATEPYQIRVIYGVPYNEFISTSDAIPTEVHSSDILQIDLGDPVVSCAGCSKPNVANGNLMFNVIDKTYQLVCLPGFQLRGNPLIECIGGYYTSALPICQSNNDLCWNSISNSLINLEKEVKMRCYIFKGMSINRSPSEQFVAQSALEPFEVRSAASMGKCVWQCVSEIRCINAEFKGNLCSLYDFEATQESLTASTDESVSLLCA